MFLMQLLQKALVKSTAVYDTLLRGRGQEVSSAPSWVTADIHYNMAAARG